MVEATFKADDSDAVRGGDCANDPARAGREPDDARGRVADATGAGDRQPRAEDADDVVSRLRARGLTPERAAHASLLAADIKRFLDRPSTPATRTELPEAPPGAPIGQPAMEFLRRFEPACSGFDRFEW